MAKKQNDVEEMVKLRDRLRDVLLEKSFRLGDFTLASGKKSDYYIDGRMASLDPEGVYCMARLFIERCRELKADCVGGLTLGADPIVGAMVALSRETVKPLRGFIVRKKTKDHGTGKLIEGELRDGDRVVVVEDVVTTGGSVMQAVAAARDAGGDVKAVVALVDRQEGGAETFSKEGLIFIPLFTTDELKRLALEKK